MMQILKRLLLGLVTLLATAGVALYYTETSAAQELKTVVSTTNISEIEKQIHDLVNAERTKHGLSPLKFNLKLVEIARGYSQQMAEENFYAHDDPQGRDFVDRYEAAGFTCGIKHDNYIYDGGENLYLMHVGKWLSPLGSVLEYYTQEEMAHEVVEGWMNSPGHKHNILTEFWQSEGIGVAVAKDGKIYVTENFC